MVKIQLPLVHMGFQRMNTHLGRVADDLSLGLDEAGVADRQTVEEVHQHDHDQEHEGEEEDVGEGTHAVELKGLSAKALNYKIVQSNSSS